MKAPETADKKELASKQIRSVTNLSLIINLALMAAKFVIGLLSGSAAVVSDAIHSLSDMITDLAVIFGVHFGSKKPDTEHPYGHGRIETFSGAFVAVALVTVGLGMIYYAARDITRGKIVVPNTAMFAVTIGSIIFKEWLYQITKRVAIRSHSPAAYANAWHHRSDALSSVAVLIGIVSLKLGFKYGDEVAAIAVGLMVVFVGINIIGDCLHELTERAVDEQTIERIKSIINADSSIRQWHELRSRTVGREVFLDLHILVDPGLNIATAHEIAETLEKAVHEQISRPVNIIVHVEPDLPDLRR
ncbi:MAG TPA: cation diffusion facilitator family transporter [Sedimentisphaerales bacterium]|nr:cation diffusion facilitator family transporter [Sedimentisphaerales bacterium]